MGRIAVILAGGRSRRMGGRDKALVKLGGQRLVDRVIARLEPQCERILVAAPHDYGTGLVHVPDAPAAPAGPVAGIYSVYEWLRTHEPEVDGFFTVPVDGPFLPGDLIRRLEAGGGPAIAADEDRAHPTYAHWTMAALGEAEPAFRSATGPSLTALAEACSAVRVVWSGQDPFFNVNSPDDVREAERRLRPD